MAEEDFEFIDSQVNRLLRLYSSAEADILRLLQQATAKGNSIVYLNSMRSSVNAILEELRSESKAWSEKTIPLVYGAAAEDPYGEKIPKASDIAKRWSLKESLLEGFGTVHQQSMAILAENAYQRLDGITTIVGRRVDDMYRRLALESSRSAIAGYDTVKNVAKNYRQSLEEQGITGFVDKAGRKWNMTTYSKMVARTTVMEAMVEGTCNRLSELDVELVKVSTHKTDCRKCQPWQGKILSITGETSGYPTLNEARQSGLFHPNCRHALGAYFNFDDEMSKLNDQIRQTKRSKK